ncbi:MAG: FkbM family methyltransferase [Chitinophagales bacterium]|nr:FkbM family methyltransferase [Chitinophagales bacterium]
MKPFREYLKPYIRPIPLDTRYLMKKTHADGIFSIQLQGYKAPLFFRKDSTDVKVFNQIFYWKEYSFDLHFQPKTIIDCGANIGMFAVWFSNRFPDAKIVSIEPSSANFAMLTKNTENYPTIQRQQNGVWNKNVNLEIENVSADEWAFTIKEVNYENENTIKAISIDEIANRHGMDTIDILKIDIEGSEKEVFEGDVSKWLPRVKVLLVELHDRMKAGCTKSVFKALEGYDYHMEICGENLVFYFNH